MNLRKGLAVAGFAVLGLGLTSCGMPSQYDIIGKYTVPEHSDGDETDLEQPVLVVFNHTDPQSIDVSWECFDKYKNGATISSMDLSNCQMEYED